MKISEYTLLEAAFHNSFGFMLNRMADANLLRTDHFEWTVPVREDVEARCFSEFILALEETGVRLEDVEARLETKDA